MRDFKGRRGSVAGLLWVVLAVASPAPADGLDERPPNLLIVLPDQMRGQALGFLGEDPVITPHLDRFAEEAMVFPHAVGNYPVCSPYRAMLMTGQYAHANGVLSNCNSNGALHGYELRQDARCWSDVLKERGYSLGYIGKWHLDSPRKPWVKSGNNSEKFAWNEWCPPERRHGFDFWYAYGTYDNHFAPEYWTTDSPRDRRVKVEQWSPEHEADQAIRFLRNEDGSWRDPEVPFALVVAMNPPHMPYQLVPERYVALYEDRTPEELVRRGNVRLGEDTSGARLARRQIKNYFAMISGVDDQFGRILTALEQEGLAGETLVVFTSDHGNCLGAHEKVSKNVHYEESMRVPLLIRWPGRIPARQDDLLISTPDLYPTLLDLMGFAEAIPDAVQGTSHAAIMRGEEGPRPTSQLYLFVPLGEPAGGRRGIRTHRHTLVLSRIEGEPEVVLHDNVADPGQLHDLAADDPELVRRLTDTELLPWLRRTADPWIEE